MEITSPERSMASAEVAWLPPRIGDSEVPSATTRIAPSHSSGARRRSVGSEVAESCSPNASTT
jgi:hypothetical protein